VNKKVRIEYNEQSKAVVTSVKLEAEIESIQDTADLLREAQDLFDKAQEFAHLKTIQKMRG